MTKLVNISDGPRGLHAKTGLVMIEVGETFDGELAANEEPVEEWFAKEGSAAAKAADPLDHDGDGRKGGVKKAE